MKNSMLLAQACLFGLLLSFSACQSLDEMGPHDESATETPAIQSSVARTPFAVLSWNRRKVAYLQGRRAETAAYFGARSTEDQDWEIEHPTQGWLGFGAAVVTSVAALIRELLDDEDDEPSEGDVMVSDSSSCSISMGSPYASSCSPNGSGGSSNYELYGYKICFYSSNGGYCAAVYQEVALSKQYSDSACTNETSSNQTLNWACDVTKP